MGWLRDEGRTAAGANGGYSVVVAILQCTRRTAAATGAYMCMGTALSSLIVAHIRRHPICQVAPWCAWWGGVDAATLCRRCAPCAAFVLRTCHAFDVQDTIYKSTYCRGTYCRGLPVRCEMPWAHRHITGGLHIALRPYSDIMPHLNGYRGLLSQQACRDGGLFQPYASLRVLRHGENPWVSCSCSCLPVHALAFSLCSCCGNLALRESDSYRS